MVHNQVVLVTGATGGLGTAVSKVFREAGWTVLEVSRSAGPDAISADLTTVDGAKSAVARALERAGHIDALVHLVGGYAGGKPIAETDDLLWERMLNLNLNAAFYMARAILPHMLAAKSGRIIMIGSRVAIDPVAKMGAYAVSKAALVALVRTIAAEVKNSGVTANIILPSVIDTPANRAQMPSVDPTKWVKPEAIARFIRWLASEESGDVNGAVIPIYGRA
jgi:NAD(P)-dependent dehydrogenase (short-subunit alcohol dehydrogenase family)